jgi:hypothetical protein
VLDRDESNIVRTTLDSSDRNDENNIALPFEALFAARDALFGPILVAQSGELVRQAVEAAPAPRHDPTQGLGRAPAPAD